MKNKQKIALVLALAIASLSSCERKCRCYHYNGSIVEFSQEEVKAQGKSCNELEKINFGLTYSLCEWVL